MSENISELAIVYAALILADDGVEITADKLQALTKAAGIEVEPVWAGLFAKALEGKNVADLLFNVGSASAAPTSAATGGGAATETAVEDKKEEEKKDEKDDESDEDMGFGLFD
uniref:60S acidic ribosomal protein P1 n=1 Tax=Anthurium amnicola TaxID=1678845 RepID=A0A1D1ZEI4_9ARAE